VDKLERLSGPGTHICWTPDAVPKSKMKLVSLVEESALLALEAEVKLLRCRRDIEERDDIPGCENCGRTHWAGVLVDLETVGKLIRCPSCVGSYRDGRRHALEGGLQDAVTPASGSQVAPTSLSWTEARLAEAAPTTFTEWWTSLKATAVPFDSKLSAAEAAWAVGRDAMVRTDANLERQADDGAVK